MQKIVKIGGVDVPMKANALTPFLFKEKFGQDIVRGMANLKRDASHGTVDVVFASRVAWVMAKASNKDLPDIEEWLEGFEMFDLLEALPDIVGLWGLNEQQSSIPKKK